MRYISTTDTNITFTDVDGKVKIVPKNRVYTHFNVDTVTFLLIERYDNEGICLFSTKAEDLEINGTTYTYEQLLDGEGISDLFSPTGLSFEVVEELPQTGEEGVIYLVPNEDETYTEYIWISDEERFELIGTTDVDLTNYYTKSESDGLFATQVVVNEEIAARIAGDGALNTALGTKADKSDTYTKSQVDDALALKQDASTAFSGDYNDLSNKPTIPVVPTNVSAFTNDAGYLTEHQSLDNYYTKTQVDTALSGKVSQTEFDTKEEVISTALNDLDENKADKTEIPDVTNLATKSEVNTALADKADKATTYTKTETDTAISTAIGQIDLSDYETKDDADVKEEVISTALNNLNTNKQDKLTAGQNITIDANNVISATGGGGTQQQADWNQTDSTAVDFIKNKPDTSEFVTKTEYNPKELAIAEALTDLNENKADKTEIPDVSTLATKTELNAKQDTLVSGTNIKTINNQSILGSGNINISGGGGNYVQYDSQDEYPVTLIKRMNRLDYDALAGNEDPNTLYIVTPIEWKVLESDNFQFGDGNPTDLFAQTLPAQQIAGNEYPTVTLYEDLDKSSSPIQGSWSYDSSAYIGTLTWTDSDGGSCSMVIEFTVIGGSDIVIDDASKITYTNPNNHCYAVEWQ